MAQPSLWGNALQDAFANPMTLGGLSLLSGGDLNSGIRSGAALQQQVQQQRQRDATQESLKGMFADPNSQFSKLDAGSRSLLESNPDMAADVFMKRLSQQMDPMAGLDADYKRAQIDKLRREAQTAGNDVYGNNGQIFQGSDGRWYSYQFAKNGRNLMQPINAPSAPQANGGGAPVTVSPFRGVGVEGNLMYDKATGANVRDVGANLSGGELAKNLGGEGGKYIMGKPREDASAAISTIQNMQEARRMLDSGILTGKGANLLLGAKGWADTLGIAGRDSQETLANTQAFSAQMGREVGNVIRAFGSGTGLSDADRDYAQAIAGGNIELTADALRKITDINERLARAKVKTYNDMVGRVEKGLSPFPLEFQVPAAAPAPAGSGFKYIGKVQQ